jgi:Predicted metalloprotease
MAIRLGTVWMMIVLVSRAATAGAGPVPTLEACIQDAPPASYRAMLSATLMASQIYAEAGIMLRWANRCLPHMLVVIMLTGEREAAMSARLQPQKAVLGFAVTRAHRVYLFYDRLSLIAGDRFEKILARVIAHEIGHVLLPAQGHSDHGLMRSQADLKEPASFTTTQREFMRRFITNGLPVPAAPKPVRAPSGPDDPSE